MLPGKSLFTLSEGRPFNEVYQIGQILTILWDCCLGSSPKHVLFTQVAARLLFFTATIIMRQLVLKAIKELRRGWLGIGQVQTQGPLVFTHIHIFFQISPLCIIISLKSWPWSFSITCKQLNDLHNNSMELFCQVVFLFFSPYKT